MGLRVDLSLQHHFLKQLFPNSHYTMPLYYFQNFVVVVVVVMTFHRSRVYIADEKMQSTPRTDYTTYEYEQQQK